jgi:hypothetical protein
MNVERIAGPTRQRRHLSGAFVESFTRRVFVDVANEVNGDTFRIVVDGADALDAINHPYAYLEAA